MTSKFNDQCLFCKIIKGEIPSLKILETDLNYAFLDINPVSEGHSLIIPKLHCERMDQVPDEYLAEILPLAKKVALANDCVNYNILQNNGAICFQHVFHVHFHVIPKRDDAEGLHFVEFKQVQKPFDELSKTLANIVARL